MKRKTLFLFLLLLLVFLAACGDASRFDAGARLTAEELAALRAQLGEQKTEQENEQKTEQETEQKNEQENEETPTNGMVFWLQSGSVYHVNATCHHIKEKPNVLSGTVEEAQTAGKSRACSSCADD